MATTEQRFNAIKVFKSQGLHEQAAHVLNELDADELKEFYSSLKNEYYNSRDEQTKDAILEDICYYSSIKVCSK